MRRSIIPFLITLLFASGLWVAVNLTGDVQSTVRIPLTVEVPEMLAVSSPLPRQITATIHGPAWKIVQFAWLATPSCVVDLSDASLTASGTVISRRALFQSITLPTSLTLSDIDPDSLVVSFDTRLQKNVAVMPALQIECRRGFEQSTPVHAEPDSISVTGAQSIIEHLAGWSTRQVHLADITTPVRMEIPISDSLGDLVTISRRPVTVTADVQETAERLFDFIPVHIANVPPGTHVRIVPPMISVLVRGGAEKLASMQSSDVHGTVDYLTAHNDHADLLPVRISAPLHTTVIRLNPYAVSWMVRTDR